MFLVLSGMKTSQHSIFNIPLDFQTIEMVFLSWIDRVYELATLCKESSDSMCLKWKHLSIQYATFIWICEWLGLYFSYDTTLFLIGTSLQLKAWLNVFRVETSRHSIFWTFIWICEQSGLYFSHDMTIFQIETSLQGKVHLPFFIYEMLCIWTCSRGPVCLQVGLIMKLVYSQGSNVQMFKSSDGQIFKSSNVPMGWLGSSQSQVNLNVPRFQCSNVQIFK